MARKQSGKFIPDSDVEFARVARNFAFGISENPEKFFVAPRDSEMITRRAQEFRDALAAAMSRGTRPRGRCTERTRPAPAPSKLSAGSPTRSA